MKVTGTQIRLAIQRCLARADMAKGQFPESLWCFPGEEKTDPAVVFAEFVACSRGVALLQVLQQAFNRMTIVQVGDETMPLSLAVNLVGSAGTSTKMARSAQRDKGRDRYSSRDTTREAGTIVAEKQMSADVAATLAASSALYASALRGAIAAGNATSFELSMHNTGFGPQQLDQAKKLLTT